MTPATPPPVGAPGTGDTRTAVLDAARALFIEGGVEALAVRRVAERAGCTTMALYTHFSGKDGLLAALFDEGFAELARAQQAVPRLGDAAARVHALCAAYRVTAQRFPHHYALMLGRFSGEHQPSIESTAAAMQTLEVLVSAVAAARAATTGAGDSARVIARQLFAFCHGWVSLEAMAFLAPGAASDDAFHQGVTALLQASAP